MCRLAKVRKDRSRSVLSKPTRGLHPLRSSSCEGIKLSSSSSLPLIPFVPMMTSSDAGAMAIECAQGSGVNLSLAQEQEYMKEPEALDMSWRLAIP